MTEVERLRGDLALLLQADGELSTEHVEEILRFVLDALRQSVVNLERRYARAAKAIGCDAAQVERLVLALARLMLQGVAQSEDEERFRGFATGELRVPEHHVAQIWACMQRNSRLLAEVVAQSDAALARSGGQPEYQSLDWRLELEVARRALHAGLAEPRFLMRLETSVGGDSGGASFSVPFACDFATLNYVCDELEGALAESKSVHSQRVFRYIR